MSRNGRIEAEILKPLEQAAVTKVVLIQVPLLRTCVLRHLPALSSLRGHRSRPRKSGARPWGNR
jgi:hypothetical protein